MFWFLQNLYKSSLTKSNFKGQNALHLFTPINGLQAGVKWATVRDSKHKAIGFKKIVTF